MDVKRIVSGLALAAGLAAGGTTAAAPASPPLVLERAIPLEGVQGRIDHLALDPAGKRLFVAELGFGAVEAIDLATGRSLGRITGLKEPQGIAYLPGRDELAVATGGDGTVRFYRAGDLSLQGALKLGDDADNVRVDRRSGRVVVGYGGGALAVIDPASRTVVKTIPLPAHPEGFQLDGGRAFVNLPNNGSVAAVDMDAGRVAARWPNAKGQLNFPMALAPEAGQVAVVYRLPARFVLFRAADGAVAQSAGTCGDSDDVFLDARRRRFYVVCGSGAVDVFEAGATAPSRVATRGGARTGLYSPELDRLFVAAREGREGGAALLVYRPGP